MDQNDRICPLKALSAAGTESGAAAASECTGPVCAWFDQTKECCAVLSIAKQLRKK